MSWWMQTESAQVSTKSEYDLLPGVRLPLVISISLKQLLMVKPKHAVITGMRKNI